MISWSKVGVAYGNTRVLGPVSLEVATGQWLGLIGPNGAGKSTMLKAAVGVAEHEGRVSLGNGAARIGLDIAWMPQRPQLPDEMGVGDYVMLGRTPHLGYLSAEGSHDVASVDSAMQRLDLFELSRRPLSTLSGGETQRVVLARALAQEAPILLLDEPTASLDIGHAIDVMEVVDDLRQAEGLTVVTAVHDLTLAGRFASRLVLLSEGLIVADGEPWEVLEEGLLREHYGSGLRVVHDVDGPTVIPMRRND